VKWPWDHWFVFIRERQTHHFNELWAKIQHSEEAAEKRHAELVQCVEMQSQAVEEAVTFRCKQLAHELGVIRKCMATRAIKKRKGARRRK